MATDVKKHATQANSWVREAHYTEKLAEAAAVPHTLVMFGQQARALWVQALISFVHFFDALPEPVAIPPVPQPSEEARKRDLLVGAVVRYTDGDIGRVVAHGHAGRPLVQWRSGYSNLMDEDKLTLIRPAPPTRAPNAEAIKRGLFIGARVTFVSVRGGVGEVIAWDSAGHPVAERDGYAESWNVAYVTLAKNSPTE